MTQHPVSDILSRWPSRQAVLEDARQGAPDLDIMAVHRMFQRNSIAPRHWASLVAGARKRGIAVSLEEIGTAHTGSPEQIGHALSHGSDKAPRKGRATNGSQPPQRRAAQ